MYQKWVDFPSAKDLVNPSLAQRLDRLQEAMRLDYGSDSPVVPVAQGAWEEACGIVAMVIHDSLSAAEGVRYDDAAEDANMQRILLRYPQYDAYDCETGPDGMDGLDLAWLFLELIHRMMGLMGMNPSRGAPTDLLCSPRLSLVWTRLVAHLVEFYLGYDRVKEGQSPLPIGRVFVYPWPDISSSKVGYVAGGHYLIQVPAYPSEARPLTTGSISHEALHVAAGVQDPLGWFRAMEYINETSEGEWLRMLQQQALDIWMWDRLWRDPEERVNQCSGIRFDDRVCVKLALDSFAWEDPVVRHSWRRLHFVMGLVVTGLHHWCSFDMPIVRKWAAQVERLYPGALLEFVNRMHGTPLDAVKAARDLAYRLREGRVSKDAPPWFKVMRRAV